MPSLDIAAGESLHYEYDAPGAAGATFVFVNALAGSTATWQHQEIGPVLRAAGFGTLCWDFRGQGQSRCGPATELSPRVVVEDLRRLAAHVRPPRPILVGLSIGGLFAAQGHLAGVPAVGLVLVNTLRKPGPRLEWINQAVVALARAGGTRLVARRLVEAGLIHGGAPTVSGRTLGEEAAEAAETPELPLEPANGNGHGDVHDAVPAGRTAKFAAIQNQEDAPPCSTCGSIMVRSGSCYKCVNCGSTSGCA
ncbi:MAG TPA: hypothetical protein DDZ42_07925 [Candidatus Rokubacteria bacterium]|nr:hypothetical protein [Candidatus Rokubacteria bacterium]